MKTLAERLNFSTTSTDENAIKIDNRRYVNFHESLCNYCTDNAIDLSNISDEDFDGAVMTMECYGTADRGEYNFWIDIDIDITGYYSTTDHEYQAVVDTEKYDDEYYSVTIERLGACGDDEDSEYIQCDFESCGSVDDVKRILKRYSIELK